MIIRRWLWYLLMYIFVVKVGASLSDNRFEGDDDEYNDEDTNVSTSEDEKRPSKISPEGSWLNFVTVNSQKKPSKKHSRHRDQKTRKLKIKSSRGDRGGTKQRELSKTLGLPGPPGPPGPRGPPGPPGAAITKEVLMKEFREMVKEAAERRAERLVVNKCPGCRERNSSNSDVTIIPRISAGFHCRLRTHVEVNSKTFLELKKFQMPFGGGTFDRGDVFNAKEGRFTAPRDGIYQFTAHLHVRTDMGRKNKKRRLKRRDNVRVLICIESLCQKHMSLEFISGLESNSRIFTISLNGLLNLKKGQYTSIYIDNSSSRSVIIQEGSDFTGVIIGV